MKISYFNFLNEGRKKTLLSLLLFCSMSIGFAQISISGKITDAAGKLSPNELMELVRFGQQASRQEGDRG